MKKSLEGMPFSVRDMRNKEHFDIDDAYLNGAAKHCGIYATGVYMALCRHANFYNQSCFPSILLICKKLNISKTQVIRSLKILQQYNIIQSEKDHGKVNKYYLIGKSHWQLPSELPKKERQKNESKLVSNRYQYPSDTGFQQTSDGYPLDTGPVSNRYPNVTKLMNQNEGENAASPLEIKIKEVEEYYRRCYQRRFSALPRISPKDKASLKELCLQTEQKDLMQIMSQYFRSSDPLIASSSYSICFFASSGIFNKLIVEINQARAIGDEKEQRRTQEQKAKADRINPVEVKEFINSLNKEVQTCN